MAEQENAGRAEAARLAKLVSKKRFDELEAGWADAVEKDAVEPDDLLFVLEQVAHAGDVALTDSLLWFLLTERASQKGAAEALGVAKRALSAFGGSAVLREEMATLYRGAHEGVAEIDTLVDATVARADVPLPLAVARIEKLLALRPGAYLIDPEREAPGSIVGFNVGSQALEASFGDAVKSYAADAIDPLQPIPADDFRALLTYDPAKLEGLAQGDPVELVTRTLRAFGPRLTLKGLKTRLEPLVPASAWSKWWAAAKPQLNRAAWVDMTSAAQAVFTLRSQPIAYEDCLKAQFNAAATADEKLGVVLDYLAEKDAAASVNADLLGFFARQLAALAASQRAAEPAVSLGALAVLAEIRKRAPDAAFHCRFLIADFGNQKSEINNLQSIALRQDDLAALLGDDPAALFRPVRNDKLAACMLGFIRAALPDGWPAVYGAALPGCSPGGCDVIAKALIEAGHADALPAAVGLVIQRPDRSAAALIWLWRAVSAGTFADALAGVDPVNVVLALFSAADNLGRGTARENARQQDLLGQVRGAITARECEPLRDVLKGADEVHARLIKGVVERSTAFTDHARTRVLEALRRTHRKLFIDHVPPWQEDAIYTTPEGLKREQDQLHHLLTVKLAEASKAVGAAASLGDLSENAEWTAAKEERDRLANRVGRIGADLKKARLITPAMANSATVTIGSAVDVKDAETGAAETFTFLGPWDADPEKGISSYLAALGAAFMGKKVGDAVTLAIDGHDRTWEIIRVRPGL